MITLLHFYISCAITLYPYLSADNSCSATDCLAVVTFFFVILDPDITGEFVVCESESSILFLAVDRLLPTVLPDLSDSSLEVSVVSFLLVLVLDLREESSLSASVFVLAVLTLDLTEESLSSSDTNVFFLVFLDFSLSTFVIFFLVFFGEDFKVESVEGRSSSERFLFCLVPLITDIAEESVEGMSSSSSDEAVTVLLLPLGDITDESVDNSSVSDITIDFFPFTFFLAIFTGDGD